MTHAREGIPHIRYQEQPHCGRVAPSIGSGRARGLQSRRNDLLERAALRTRTPLVRSIPRYTSKWRLLLDAKLWRTPFVDIDEQLV